MSSDTSRPNKPQSTPFNQQRIKKLLPTIEIDGIVAVFFIVAIIFIPVGNQLLKDSLSIAEYSIQYDGSGTSNSFNDCHIHHSNQGTNCTLTIKFERDAVGPFFVYYELDNFYQNDRRYVKSVDTSQLEGQTPSASNAEPYCYPMTKNGSLLLNPCGLIANTMFNDIFYLTGDTEASGYELDTDGVSWYFDRHFKFQQVDGFVSAKVHSSSSDANYNESCISALGHKHTDCKEYIDPTDGSRYLFWYPDDDNVQYLYETYPSIVSPIEGVENERFINWMRLGGLPRFRKLYGKIDADFKKGDEVEVMVILNYEVSAMDVSKSLVVTNLALYGAKNAALGRCYIVVGVISLWVGLIFALKRIVKPRPAADIRQIAWSM